MIGLGPLNDDDESNVDAVVDLVRATEPHVVSLVEVDEQWDGPSVLDDLANRVGYASVFAPAFEHGTDTPRGGFGNALLSKLPIRAVRQRQLTWPTTVFDGTEPSEPRAVVFLRACP
jgi:endonuclease/exonuclease/phosphatase family metal-dependent hydrolase